MYISSLVCSLYSQSLTRSVLLEEEIEKNRDKISQTRNRSSPGKKEATIHLVKGREKERESRGNKEDGAGPHKEPSSSYPHPSILWQVLMSLSTERSERQRHSSSSVKRDTTTTTTTRKRHKSPLFSFASSLAMTKQTPRALTYSN